MPQLVVIKNKTVLAPPNLFRLVLKSIFDLPNFTRQEEDSMMDSFISWSNAIKIENEKLAFIQAQDIKQFGRVIITEHKYSDVEHQLENMADMIRKNTAGGFDKSKELYKKHKIDYRKVYRLPEAYTEEDFRQGRMFGEIHKFTNPEDYK